MRRPGHDHTGPRYRYDVLWRSRQRRAWRRAVRSFERTWTLLEARVDAMTPAELALAAAEPERAA